jgi:flagellar basal-body rod modification protein FlgD
MAIQAASGTTTSSTQALSSLTGRNAVTKESFLQLLITQMRYQDPLSPMDNQEFLAQLAQFSSLEQMQNLNDKYDSSMALTQSLNNSAAAGLIGRQVRASGDTLSLGSSGGVEVGYYLQADAAEVSISVTDSTGKIVRGLTSTDGGSGSHRLTWDGRDDAGSRLPAGSYTFKVTAKDEDGAAVTASSVVSGTVSGVTYRNGSAYLLVDGREVSLSEVLEVYQAGS